ncbi:MAG: GTPase Era [Actinobacteria bacterium HGW-Actinobacteria-6]|jgi:GTP-binding protein Era|nr:MAG: GTPase Era [Actinobacteria bacterium HGW-Actinobacteria-6]
MTEPTYEVVKSGFVALVGRPNAGKSTLVNALVGSKVAITSNTPQTTRHRLRAIVDQEDAQIVFVDTPGLHKPEDALGEELNRSAMMALSDVDVACLVIDASQQIGPGDRWVAHRVAEAKAARVLILTKVDIARPEEVEKQLVVARGLAKFDEVVVCSAREAFNLDGVIAAVKSHLPDGPRYFPRDMPTDQSVVVMLAEFIRERVLHNTRDEVPHAVGVVIEDMKYSKKSDTTTIMAIIFVERESQKGIIVGKSGDMIRKIGTDARVDLERLLGTKVYLDLRVKVKKDWRRDASQIKRFGYGEGR